MIDGTQMSQRQWCVSGGIVKIIQISGNSNKIIFQEGFKSVPR